MNEWMNEYGSFGPSRHYTQQLPRAPRLPHDTLGSQPPIYCSPLQPKRSASCEVFLHPARIISILRSRPGSSLQMSYSFWFWKHQAKSIIINRQLKYRNHSKTPNIILQDCEIMTCKLMGDRIKECVTTICYSNRVFLSYPSHTIFC